MSRVQRLQTIRDAAAIFPKGQILLIGDSITYNSGADELCGMKALNAGISGTRVRDWPSFAKELTDKTRPKIVILALGVNDADRRKTFDIREWSTQYSNLTAAVAPTKTAVVGITDIRNTVMHDRISHMNAELAKYPGYIPPMPRRASLTKDGVHLTGKGKRAWIAWLVKACRLI